MIADETNNSRNSVARKVNLRVELNGRAIENLKARTNTRRKKGHRHCHCCPVVDQTHFVDPTGMVRG